MPAGGQQALKYFSYILVMYLGKVAKLLEELFGYLRYWRGGVSKEQFTILFARCFENNILIRKDFFTVVIRISLQME